MYNRYIPDGARYTRISEADDAPSAPPTQSTPQPLAAEPAEEKSGGLAALLNGLKLEKLDSGDILLLLIMLFLFLEGDDLELIITLGLMLLLGLD